MTGGTIDPLTLWLQAGVGGGTGNQPPLFRRGVITRKGSGRTWHHHGVQRGAQNTGCEHKQIHPNSKKRGMWTPNLKSEHQQGQLPPFFWGCVEEGRIIQSSWAGTTLLDSLLFALGLTCGVGSPDLLKRWGRARIRRRAVERWRSGHLDGPCSTWSTSAVMFAH